MEKKGCYREMVVVEKMTVKVLLYTYYSYSVSNHKDLTAKRISLDQKGSIFQSLYCKDHPNHAVRA